jgi:hypothetical protein
MRNSQGLEGDCGAFNLHVNVGLPHAALWWEVFKTVPPMMSPGAVAFLPGCTLMCKRLSVPLWSRPRGNMTFAATGTSGFLNVTNFLQQASSILHTHSFQPRSK